MPNRIDSEFLDLEVVNKKSQLTKQQIPMFWGMEGTIEIGLNFFHLVGQIA